LVEFDKDMSHLKIRFFGFIYANLQCVANLHQNLLIFVYAILFVPHINHFPLVIPNQYATAAPNTHATTKFVISLNFAIDGLFLYVSFDSKPTLANIFHFSSFGRACCGFRIC
jgi:hypothetical protein